MKIIVTEDNAGRLTAEYVKHRILAFKPTADRPFVIAFPTGGTPVDMYARLVEMYKAGELSFKNVVSFNLDEYVGLPITHPESYYGFMHRNLFDHIDMPAANINIPDGNAKDPAAFCQAYEAKIKALGGLELFLGGVGSNGHIAFNEPGSPFDSRTRRVELTEKTIQDNARFFGGDIKAVPTAAITMGLGTILEAREVVIMATGANKAPAIWRAVEGNPSVDWPITCLQTHKNTFLVTDKPAASELSAVALEDNQVCSFN